VKVNIGSEVKGPLNEPKLEVGEKKNLPLSTLSSSLRSDACVLDALSRGLTEAHACFSYESRAQRNVSELGNVSVLRRRGARAPASGVAAV
jgi:hypothetical protein